MRKFLQSALVIILIANNGYTQTKQWSVGLTTGLIYHYFKTPTKELYLNTSEVSLNYLAFVSTAWGRKQQVLTELSFDHYQNVFAYNQNINSVKSNNSYYSSNLSILYLLFNITKLNWKHYLGPTFSYSIIHTNVAYTDLTDPPFNERYTIIATPWTSHFWAGLNYEGRISVGHQLSVIYNIGYSLNLDEISNINKYGQFRFKSNAGISYSF